MRGKSRLRVFRYLNGLSQEDLSAKTKISQSRISRFERGVGTIDSEEKERIAKVLELKPEQLSET